MNIWAASSGKVLYDWIQWHTKRKMGMVPLLLVWHLLFRYPWHKDERLLTDNSRITVIGLLVYHPWLGSGVFLSACIYGLNSLFDVFLFLSPQARHTGAKMLGMLVSRTSQVSAPVTPEGQTPLQVVTKLVQFHLQSKSAIQRMTTAMLVMEWATVHKVQMVI